MDYAGLNFRTPDPEPSAAGLLQRYAPSRPRATDVSGVGALTGPVADDRLVEQAQYDDRSGDVARFLLRELPDRQNQVLRALADDDPDAVRDHLDSIDSFVQDHRQDLANWQLFRSAGPEGELIERNVKSLLSGTYRNEWGVKGDNGEMFTAQMAYDDMGGEAVARRARRLHRELGVTDDTARAISDPNDGMHAVFSPYATAISGLDKLQKSGADPDAVRRARDSMVTNLKTAEAFVQEFGPEFGDSARLAGFVREFDRVFNDKGMAPGLDFMRNVAQGYLSADRDDATGYLSAVVSLRDGVAAGLAQPTDGQTMGRARLHEANSLVSAYIQEAAALGAPLPVDSSLYSAALSTAAKRAAVMSGVYGIDLRSGETGVSRRVAQMALMQLGVVGADDGGMTEFINTLAPALDTYMGSDGPPAMVKGQNGQQYVQPADGMFRELETSVRRAAGQKLWDLWRRSGGHANGAGGLLTELAGNPEWRQELVDAIKKPLSARLLDERAAGIIAEEIALNPVSESPKTIYQAFLDRSGLLDATGAPAVPAELMVQHESGGAPNHPVTKDTLVKLAAAPDAVIPVARGDKSLRGALETYAKASLKGTAENADQSDVYNKAKSLARLVVRAGGGEEDRDVARAVTVAFGGSLDKTLIKSGGAALELESLAQRVRAGDPDAVMAAGLMVSKVNEDPTKLTAALGRFGQDFLRMGKASWLGSALPVVGTPLMAYAALQRPLQRIRDVGSLSERLLRWGAGKISGSRDSYKSAELKSYAGTSIAAFGAVVQALHDQGIDTNDLGKCLPQAIQILQAKNQLNGTVFVKSGFVGTDGEVNEFRLLRRLQDKAYVDPSTVKPTAGNPDRDVLSRAFAPLVSESKAYQEAFRRVSDHYRRFGVADGELNSMQGAVMDEIHKAYKRGGAAEALRAVGKIEQRTPMFLPVVRQGKDGKLHLTDQYSWEPGALTEEQKAARWEQYRQAHADLGFTLTDMDYQRAQLFGPTFKREAMARQDMMLAALARRQGTNTADQSKQSED